MHFSKRRCKFIVKYSEGLSLKFSSSQAREEALHTKLVSPAVTLLVLKYISIKVDIVQNSVMTQHQNPNKLQRSRKSVLYL